MRRLHYSITCLAVVLIGLNFTHVLGSESNLLYYFEDKADPKVPTNAGDGQAILHYAGGSHQTPEQHKFGDGSMAIGEEAPASRHAVSGFASAPSEFGEINKMTITAWVRVPTSAINFTIFARKPYGTAGSFWFLYDNRSKKLVFRVIGAGGPGADGKKNVGYLISNRINCLFADEWINIGMTFDDGKVVFYVNGMEAGTADTVKLGFSSIPAYKGSFLAGFPDLMAGSYVDDFGFFTDRALTSAEMDQIYSKGLADLVKISTSPAAKP